MTEKEGVLAWHFAAPVEEMDVLTPPEMVGVTYRVNGPPRCCEHGLHGSVRAIDALKYAQSAVIRQTRHTGAIDRRRDKLCSTERTPLWQADATEVLHEFVCYCAEECLKREREEGREPDARAWQAVAAKRRWLNEEADYRRQRRARTLPPKELQELRVKATERLEAARTEAWTAACAAFWAAPEPAWYGAAWAAAQATGVEAVWTIASTVAETVGKTVWWATHSRTAWAEAWNAMNAELERRLLALQ